MHAAAVIDISHENDSKNLGGRPSLSKGERTVGIHVRVPESLRDRTREEMQRGELPIAVRGLLQGYLDLPQHVREKLNSEDKIRKAMAQIGALISETYTDQFIM